MNPHERTIVWRDAQSDPPDYGRDVLVATDLYDRMELAVGKRDHTDGEGEWYGTPVDEDGNNYSLSDWWAELPAPPEAGA